MRIEGIELINFKGHRHSTFAFTPGTNILLGENGSGKSSIIMAIGVAIFNSKPNTLKELIRYDSTTATVKVLFEHNGVTYNVVRTFGETSSWVVFANNEFAADGSEAVQKYLATVFGADLDTLFKYVVGSQQFGLSTPFLMGATLRAKIFNAIFGVDQWEAAWDNLRDTTKYIKEGLIEVESRINRLHEIEEELAHIDARLARFVGEIEGLRFGMQAIKADIRNMDREGYLKELAKYNQIAQANDEKAEKREMILVERASLISLLADCTDGRKKLPELYKQKEKYITYISDLEHNAVIAKLDTEFSKYGICPMCGTPVGIEHLNRLEWRTLFPVSDPTSTIDYYKGLLEEESDYIARLEEIATELAELEPDDIPEYPQFDDTKWAGLQHRLQEKQRQEEGLIHRANYDEERKLEIQRKLDGRATLEAERKVLLHKLNACEEIRFVCREVGPKAAAILRENVQEIANIFIGETLHDSPTLRWDEDYMLWIKWGDRETPITSLSGGEQTMTALAVRVALAEQYGVLILDEPTLSLDSNAKQRLVEFISEQNFGQCIVATHYVGFDGNVVEL